MTASFGAWGLSKATGIARQEIEKDCVLAFACTRSMQQENIIGICV